MKKLLFAGGLSVAIAAGIWFGVPIYAANKFKGELDAHFAEKSDARAGYDDAKLDYWKDRAEIGTVVDVLALEVGGVNLRFLATFKGLVVEGYDLDAANTAMAGADGISEQVAERISWSGFTMINETGSASLAGKAGALSGVKVDKLDLENIIASVGAAFGSVEQADIGFSLQDGADTFQVLMGSLAARQIASSGADAIDIANFEIDGVFAGNNASGDFSTDLGSLAYENLTIGELISVNRFENKAFNLELNVFVPTPGGDAPEAFTGKVSYDSYLIENADVDSAIFSFFPQLVDILKRPDGEPEPEEFAWVLEVLLSTMERTVASNTGMDVIQMTNFVMDFPKLQRQTIGRMEARDYRGLKIGRLEMVDVVQANPDGLTVRQGSQKYEGVDLSALPAYLRKVAGGVVTPDSLAHAQAHYRDSTIAEAIPPITFGRWQLQDQVFTLPDETSIHIGDVSMTPMRADAGGQIQFAMTVSGLTVPSDKLAETLPAARARLDMLKALGIEQVVVGYGIDITGNPAAGTINIDNLSVAMEQLGAISLSGKINGIDIEALRQLPQPAWSGPLMQSGIGDVAIEVNDESLRAFAFKVLSEQQGVNPDEMAEELATQAEQLAVQLGSERATSIGDAIAAFLREGGTVKFTAVQDEPALVDEIKTTLQTQGPTAVIDLLQVEAIHTP